MLEANNRGGNTTHKIFNILFQIHTCNNYNKLKFLKRAKQNNLVNFQIVEEIPRFDLRKL